MIKKNSFKTKSHMMSHMISVGVRLVSSFLLEFICSIENSDEQPLIAKFNALKSLDLY